jgi:hypothetical protein
VRKDLARAFRTLDQGDAGAETVPRLTALIERVLALEAAPAQGDR